MSEGDSRSRQLRTRRVTLGVVLISFALGMFVASNNESTSRYSGSEYVAALIGQGTGFALAFGMIAWVICRSIRS